MNTYETQSKSLYVSIQMYYPKPAGKADARLQQNLQAKISASKPSI